MRKIFIIAAFIAILSVVFAANAQNSQRHCVGVGTDNPKAAFQVGSTNLFVQRDQGGSMEIGGNNNIANIVDAGTPYMDFHYGVGSPQDYNMRIINDGNRKLTVTGAPGGPATLQVNGNLAFGDGSVQSSALPSGMIAMFDTACPAGWTHFAALDGKVARGAATSGGTGGADTHAHTHGGAGVRGGDRSVATSNAINAASSWPPYLEIVFCKKD